MSTLVVASLRRLFIVLRPLIQPDSYRPKFCRSRRGVAGVKAGFACFLQLAQAFSIFIVLPSFVTISPSRGALSSK